MNLNCFASDIFQAQIANNLYVITTFDFLIVVSSYLVQSFILVLELKKFSYVRIRLFDSVFVDIACFTAALFFEFCLVLIPEFFWTFVDLSWYLGCFD